MRKNGQRGQVLIMGVLVILILTLAVFILVDVHNIVRGKMKMNTAETSAALAAAKWQRETLNLIGEINLVKGCVVMMEDDSLIPAPEVTLTRWQENNWTEAQKASYIRRRQIQSRNRTLTEMQSRLAFLGPLVGLAAAQQTAKNNGLAANNPAVKNYCDRYFGFSYGPHNGFDWSRPYFEMVRAIAEQGGAIQPSGSARQTPDVIGPTGVVLSDIELYRAIHSERWCYWQLRAIAKKGGESGDWYKIDLDPDYSVVESDIYPVLVGSGSGGFGVDEKTHFELAGGRDFFEDDDDALPSITWYKYHKSWTPDRDSDAYNAWVEDWVKDKNWRGTLKKGYDYEGPVAAAAGFVDIDSVTPMAARNRSLLLDRNVRAKPKRTSRIGRSPGNDGGVRRGVWAKVLGCFDSDTPPMTIPMVLPVFTEAVIYPTYRAYKGNLIGSDGSLWSFLHWLSAGGDIHDTEIPPQYDYFVSALRKLEDQNWLKHGYNASFGGVDAMPVSALFSDAYKYSESNPGGAGWLQQAFVGSDASVPADAKDGVYQDRDRPLPDGSIRIYEGGGSVLYVVRDTSIKTNERVSCEGSVVATYPVHGGGPGPGTVGGGSSSFGPPRM